MNSLKLYDNVEVGDTISFPNSRLLVKEGVVASVKGLNGHAKVIKVTSGQEFAISKYKTDYVLWRD
jgi:hypothetical protein